MDIDLLERCRSGDVDAFEGLVGLWADRAFAVARALASDAREATADAFVAAWNAMPAMHSRTSFRPWLMSQVARAAERQGSARDAQMRETMLGGATRPARADKAIADLLATAGSARAPSTLFEDAVASRLADIVAMEARADTSDPAGAWLRALEPTAWCAVPVRARAPLHEGSRLRARGKIGAAGRTSDRSVVVALEPGARISWTTQSRPSFAPPIEFRWRIEIGAADVAVLLRGIALPPGPTGRMAKRAYDRHAESMLPEMHRGAARLARGSG